MWSGDSLTALTGGPPEPHPHPHPDADADAEAAGRDVMVVCRVSKDPNEQPDFF